MHDERASQAPDPAPHRPLLPAPADDTAARISEEARASPSAGLSLDGALSGLRHPHSASIIAGVSVRVGSVPGVGAIPDIRRCGLRDRDIGRRGTGCRPARCRRASRGARRARALTRRGFRQAIALTPATIAATSTENSGVEYSSFGTDLGGSHINENAARASTSSAAQIAGSSR
jgi:hypothetical protein